MKTVINIKMKNIKYIIAICLFFAISLSYGQNQTTRNLERPELRIFEGTWEGNNNMDMTFLLELTFKKVYYEKGNFLVDQLVGAGYLTNPGKKDREYVVEIERADLINRDSIVILKLNGFDHLKGKYIELNLELNKSEDTTAQLTVMNKETIVINGKVNGKTWDSGFSFPSSWTLTKTK